MLPFIDENMPLSGRSKTTMIPNAYQKLIKSWFDTNKTTVMQCPAQSPDLNPIENLWKQLDDKVRLHSRFRNAKEMVS